MKAHLPAGAALIALCFLPVTRTPAETLRFTPERFAQMEARIAQGRDIAGAGAEAFAWGEGYVLRAYLEMYLGTEARDGVGDPAYLDRFVSIADQVLGQRDCFRARTDPRIKPGPVWSVAGKYTVGRLVLRDEQGRHALLLRSIRYAYNDQTKVSVTPGTRPGTFTLSTQNAFWQEHGEADVTYADLSLDPASDRYFQRVINDPRYVADEGFRRVEDPACKPSFLLVALDTRERRSADTVLAAVTEEALVPAIVPYYGYIGPIFAPMAAFAGLVHRRPQLRETYAEAAGRYLRAARDALDAWEPCWREGPGEGQGYYLLTEKGAGMWCDGIMAPFNYLCGAGQVLLDLWTCTGEPRALDHATRIARLFRGSCVKHPNGSYSFPYWSPVGYEGWTKAQRLSENTPEYGGTTSAEDLSHGAWEVEFAVMCQERGIVFTRSDMRRFAGTFVRNLWRGPGESLALRVDGTGEGSAGTDVAGARWLDLCPLEPRLFDLNRDLWQARSYSEGAYEHLACGYARLFRWQEVLGR
jgi:hypothetical protein